MVMVSVPGLWTVTPFLPVWKIVVYPSSDYLFMLARNFLSSESTSASCAVLDSCSKGSRGLFAVISFMSSGRYTSMFDGPVFGKFSSGLMKCDVAPESMIIWCLRRFSFLPSDLLVHLFPVLFIVSCVFFSSDVLVLLMLSSSVSSSSLIVSSGAQ